MRMFRSRAFSATNGLSFAMFFGAFGAIFLLSQFFQTAQGYGPLEAGLRTLPWTGMPMIVAPIAGILGQRYGTRPLMVAGLALQAIGLAWIGIVSEPETPFVELIAPFVITGTGMSLIFPTAAATVLASVRPEEAGKASGANNAIREIGGVMGVAVLASVFAANGGYESPQAFTDGVDGGAARRGGRAGDRRDPGPVRALGHGQGAGGGRGRGARAAPRPRARARAGRGLAQRTPSQPHRTSRRPRCIGAVARDVRRGRAALARVKVAKFGLTIGPFSPYSVPSLHGGCQSLPGVAPARRNA